MNTLYEPSFEHDNCGIGAVVSIDGIKSRKVVDRALSIVEKLEHRAGKDASGKTGDGVGILLQICHEFFKTAAGDAGIFLGEEGEYGIGQFFFPQEESLVEAEQARFESECSLAGLKFLGWRRVPVLSDVLGEKALECMPTIIQGFVEKPSDCEKGLAFDRLLYGLRRSFEKNDSVPAKTYICSLSSRTIVYKGMFLVQQLRTFYRDLLSDGYVSAVGIVHSRFSTNTNPSWQRAHPNRFIAHNGEINTIRGNADRMLARNGEIDLTGSDSAMLDNTLEYYVMNGMEFPQAVLMCIPQAWKHDNSLSQERKDFYHYWATMMEPWDGPAAILFSDGEIFGATLDRNGLRPSRYYITKDNMLILSSEVGVLNIPESSIVTKSRLEPGKILLVDMKNQRLISNDEIKDLYASKFPYGEWLSQNLMPLGSLKIPNKKIPVSSQEERDRLYKAFGWCLEDVNEMILPMAKNGVEPTGAMGVDIPLAVMSEKHPPLFNYFKQLFAQVTNPPIDSLREKIVTDTTVYVGSDGDILHPAGKNCHVLEINNPILTGVDLLKISALNQKGLRAVKVSMLYDFPKSGEGQAADGKNLETAVENLCAQVDKVYDEGFNIVILSDRGVDCEHAAIPALLAVSAVEQHLIRRKRRTLCSVILESGEIRDVHQAAMCLGYGARAVNPYLAHECISELIDKKLLDKDYHTAIEDYNKAIMNGIVKIAAKMGISTLQSYQSAQIFEAVGISKELTEKYFTNTVSRIGGIGLKEIEEDINFRHSAAFEVKLEDQLTVNNRLMKLDMLGAHKYKVGENCEDHLITPQLIKLLQESCQNGDYEEFKKYSEMVDDSAHPHTLRALVQFDFENASPIDISEVESVEEIVKRFKTGAMSYGSISEEAHKCLAAAMNRLHGKSNSGEGGEKADRFGTEYSSAIKQVASGRFGVTEEYLLSAKEIQIKCAQGAKPGEGGHLPGKKVYPWIADTRYATPGVSLISPPPHHDIYSIEDLAQLIYDLKNANRRADISVKLVSEAGVGTIAAGVAKAGAQIILISGHDGGTGAAPISSIHHAGLPWEMGLAETHQTLIQNNLRGLVRLETDGKLMDGRDVAIAAILGAEEFGFATAPLIVMGCKMLRVCNLDTCPFGVATQNEKLRSAFPGKPEYVENFMRYVAQEMREIMAKLGVRSVVELVGRTDLLKLKKKQGFSRANLLDVSRILAPTDDTWKTHFENGKLKDEKETLEFSIDALRLLPVMDNSRLTTLKYDLQCTDRTAGTILGSVIQEKYGNTLPEDRYVVHFTGGAGQSFGAFIPKGLTLRLCGDANDAVGKGLSGGKIVVQPSEDFEGRADENIIVGNVAFFGATSGRGFVNGVAGERFCVRNSGAVVVAEGCGDHGLEYMTGGTAVILGKTGKNLCAGMSGGVAYILDENHDLYKRLNKEMVTMYDLDDETTVLREMSDCENLRALIEQHLEETGSEKAKEILGDWENFIPRFKKIIPNDYLRMMTEIRLAEEAGESRSEAVMTAFKKVTA
ncbi:glutamate synthase large subunit [uncultured Treponema sp.]|uniref:glutamate synthase large subunit n=1 Tax=uncultured Treponema sp. TaxID=162155 RepID=UPI0015BCBCA9|nr:glutamate synthase large subunit [uncultured Treponema sp.]